MNIEREQSLMRQYLLGELDQQQQEQLEERVLTSPDYKEEVLITEEELLEDFVNRTLSPRELELFVKAYSASPLRWRKVKIAQALNNYVINHPPVPQQITQHKSWVKSLIDFFSAKNSFRQFSLAALVILLLVGGSLAYWWIAHESRADFQVLMQLNGPDSEILQPDNTVVSVSLPSLVLRSPGESRTIAISKQTKTVQLRLADPSGGTNMFRATLKDGAAAQVFSLDNLRGRQIGQQSVLVLQIPARMLKPQEYQLEISEKSPSNYEEPATFSLHVEETR